MDTKENIPIAYKDLEKPKEKTEATPAYFKPEMSAKEYFQHQIDASYAFNEPFMMQRPTDLEDLKALCEMCQIVEEGFCCPEHCCDVSFLFLVILFKMSFVVVIVGYMQMRSLQSQKVVITKTKL